MDMIIPDNPPEIQILTLGDIPRLIDCVRRCYGDSYPNSLMYDAEQLKVAVENGLMHSIVARHQDGHIIGHCALTFDGANNTCPEAGKMIVDPDYRGHHIAELMAKKRIELAKELNLPGFWTECVTNHPYSQHEMITFGAKETGVLLGASPSTIHMEGLENFSDTRMSLLTLYLSIKDASHQIYIPPHHADLVRQLASKINVQRTILHPLVDGIGKTQYLTEINQPIQTAHLKIQHIGEDFISSLSQELENLSHQNLASIFLDLPINQESAARAHTELERMGFIWGSWIPNYSANGDILRLQKINQAINPVEIICARPEGEIIKSYVVSEWEKVAKKTKT